MAARLRKMSKHITGIEPETHKEFTLFKIKNDAASNDEALKLLLTHSKRSEQKGAA